MTSTLRIAGALIAGLLALAPAAAEVPDKIEAILIRAEDLRDSEPAVPYASNDDPDVRVRALLAIGRIGNPADAAAMTFALHDADPNVRAMAAFALGEAFDADTISTFRGRMPETVSDELRRALAGDESPVVRMRAIEALGKVRAFDVVPPIAAATSDALVALSSDKESTHTVATVSAGLTALLRLGGSDNTALFATAAQAPDPTIRAQALDMLSRLSPEAGHTAARAAIADAVPPVRVAAMLALARAAEPQDVPILEPFTKSEDPREVYAAWYALGCVGDDAALALLRKRATELVDENLAAGPEWAVKHGRQANELHVIVEALGAASSATEDLELLDRLRGLDAPTGYVALPAFASVAVRTHAEDRVTTPPAGFRAANPIALRYWAESLGIAGTDRARAELAGLFMAKNAPPKARENLEIARPQIFESLVRSTAAVDPAAAAAMLDGVGDVTSRYVRETAASLWADEDLALEPTDNTISALSAMMLDHRDSSPDAALAVLDALANFRGPELAAPMEAAANNPSRLVRLRALGLLNRPDDFVTVGKYRSSSARVLAPKIEETEFYQNLAERGEKVVVALIETEGAGTFGFVLDAEAAPITVENFLSLAQAGYFNGLTFHRVVPNFVIQGGDPRNDMRGGPNYSIPCEINTLPFGAGSLGMALSGKDTGGSQFFVCLAPQPRLDGGYTVFGRMIDDIEPFSRVPGIVDITTDPMALCDVSPFTVIRKVDVYVSR